MAFLDRLIESRKASIAMLDERIAEVVKAEGVAKTPAGRRAYHQVRRQAEERRKRLQEELAAFQDELGTYGPGGVNEAKKAK